ncbi:MAG: 4a-hydroxytetrahydrobiopterin dehydratase [Frankiaceae bacterium]|nr:4a-hydroxytetrahydrobiopterin dehydratase [Frankiaceae bacterium]
MIERITPEQFHAADGVGDWRVVGGVARASFRTGSFAAGVALVNRIAELSEAADHHPDIDLRYSSVSVHLITHHVQGLSMRDVELARAISIAAREMGVPADNTAVAVDE